MGRRPTQEEHVATALGRWPLIRVERLIAFRRHLAAARAAAHADAEGLAPLAIALEEIGAGCLGRAEALGSYRTPLKRCLRLESENGRKYDELFKTVTHGRNSGMHEGAWVRHVASNGVELAIIIEDALARDIMERQEQKANDPTAAWRVENFMVNDPICAQLWQTIGHIRRVMLRNSFSFLPLWVDELSDWRLIGDHALAEWLGPHGEGRKEKQQLSLEEAMSPTSGLILSKPAPAISPDTGRDLVLAATKNGPALIVDPQHKNRLHGIVTAFDLL